MLLDTLPCVPETGPGFGMSRERTPAGRWLPSRRRSVARGGLAGLHLVGCAPVGATPAACDRRSPDRPRPAWDDNRTCRHAACIIRATAAASAFFFAVSCTAWYPVRPPAAVADRRAERVRVTLPGDETLTLRDPRVVADSLVGRPEHQVEAERVAVALSQIRELEVRRTDALATALLVGVLTVTGLVIVGCAVGCVPLE